jgi:ATP-dependent Lhr-like helicase
LAFRSRRSRPFASLARDGLAGTAGGARDECLLSVLTSSAAGGRRAPGLVEPPAGPSPRLQQEVVARLGWSSLRPVQEAAGQALLDGSNAVVLAPTAGGKTEAAVFPVLSRLIEDPPDRVGAVYMAPLRALLNNQAERLGLYTEMVGLRRFMWHGDVSDHQRRQFLREPAELLMTTPESLEVLFLSRRVQPALLFGDLRAIVVDEIHAMAGTDRGAHLMSVLERLVRLSRHDVQRVGLSATVGNPGTIVEWLQGTSRRSATVIDPPRPPQRRRILIVHRPEIGTLAQAAARVARGTKSLFFCQSRATTEAVAESMHRAGIQVFVHHSSVSREERALAEEHFHHGSDACIVCTSTLELGIDVGDLDRVLQADAPDTVSSFLQRMGRTGRRAGQVANTTFFCETSDSVLQATALVELAKAGWVEDIEIKDRCWPALLHQLLAMSLASDGMAPEGAWAHLSVVPDFRGIHRAEFDRLVAWMLREQSLVLTAGRLVLGPVAEKRFGRRNFAEFYAVFSSPQTYTVRTQAGQPLSSLSQGFVDRLVDGVSCFPLGGRPWAVLRVQHEDRRVLVEAAPRGREPTWGGFLPQFLSDKVCGKILEVLTSREAYDYLTPEAAQLVEHQRRAFAGILEPGRGGFEFDTDEARWWTFADGRINGTLRSALEAVGNDWKVVPDNYVLRIRGAGVDQHRFWQALDRLADPEFWEDERLWQQVGASLPTYRLSKFQPLLPPWVVREMVAAYLLDVDGAWIWLRDAARLAGRTSIPAEPGPTLPDRTSSESKAVEVLPEPASAMRERRWIDSEQALLDLCAVLRDEPVAGVDVETTVQDRALCLIQIAGRRGTYLIDALEVSDLSPLAEWLASPAWIKVIHNAAFERSVLGRYGFTLGGVVDTLAVSRRQRGRKADGGHSLKAVCQRELGLAIDKTEQTSDWSRRPLTGRQMDYAALDAEILLRLYDHFGALPAEPGAAIQIELTASEAEARQDG